VARFRLFQRTGAIGVALTAYDIWRRIPKQHRRMIIRQGRKYGPVIVAKVVQQRRKRHPPR
jgi:hypothetical protein